MAREWTEEQKQKASEAMKARHAAKQSKEALGRTRVPLSGKRDILTSNTPEGFVDRYVNDEKGQVQRLMAAGYEIVHNESTGEVTADNYRDVQGAVSKDVGKGVTAYLMRQRQEYYDEDQKLKQQEVDATEESIQRDKRQEGDGYIGEVGIK